MLNLNTQKSTPISMTYGDLLIIFQKRIRKIFSIAVKEHADVLILGAFGCGAFGNPSNIVAYAFKTVQEDFLHSFETIEYAIYHSFLDMDNYIDFREVMGFDSSVGGKKEK